MATLEVRNPTLIDLVKRMDPNNQGIAAIAEMLNQTNEILQDMTFVEGNLTTGHRVTIRTGLPSVTWRKLYGGVQSSKSTTAQVDESTGNLEALSIVDAQLVELNGNTAAFRLSEDKAFIEAMNQEMATTVMYGTESTTPEKFTGFAPRYNDLAANNAENIILGGGSGSDNASIWLVVWSPETCFGIVPKGVPGGLQSQDLGKYLHQNIDGAGGAAMVYGTHYRWAAGLCVKDWRYVVRIANIDKSALSTTWTNGAFSSGADLSNLMFDAIRRVPNMAMGRAAFYMSRDTLSTLMKQTSAKTNQSTLTSANVAGTMVDSFMGVPIRRVDAMAADESLVS